MRHVHDPIGAVTHPNPYPYYDRLVAECPLHHDEALGQWVATGGSAVREVLESELCLVRPIGEPIPAALLDSPAGEIFGRLVRMLDGERHDAIKQAVSAALASVDLDQAARLSDRWTQVLVADRLAHASRAGSPDDIAAVSVYVLGSLLGIADSQLPQLALWASDFARCLAPASSPEQIERGKAAAGELDGLVRALVTSKESRAANSLVGMLARAARGIETDSLEVIVANAIGFLFQTYDATAGLIGITLRTLLNHPALHNQAATNPDRLREVILEVLRYDAPVQNTRRFVARDGIVAGQAMRRGDVILVVLAAANRDPEVNPDPELFRIHRDDPRMFSFGAGPHACPGVDLATTIAQAAVARLLADGVDLAALVGGAAYQPSANVRVPITELSEQEVSQR